MSLALAAGDARLRLSPAGGTILEATVGGVPILRPFAGDPAGPVAPGAAASFPLVPFGNRLAGNAFDFEGAAYALAPNAADPLYLHGDGWLGRWDVADAAADRARLVFAHASPAYTYRAEQRFAVFAAGFEVALAVTNTGPRAMPFGLGQHFYLPLTPRTRLAAPARRFVTEGEHHLPGPVEAIPERLDFAAPREIPREWINNGFEGWTGRAAVDWPERGAALALTADCERYVLYHPDAAYEPGFRDDFFCFEPMTHAVDAHHRDGGLVRLAPGETLTLTVRLEARPLAAAGAPGAAHQENAPS